MAKRLTVPVAFLRDRVNHVLAHRSTAHDALLDKVTPQQAYRLGAASALESVLHETGNYRGFGYLDGWREGTDESRRAYY